MVTQPCVSGSSPYWIYLKNTKSITLDLKNLISTLQAIKKNQNRVTLNIDYNTNTVYINGKDILYTMKGF